MLTRDAATRRTTMELIVQSLDSLDMLVRIFGFLSPDDIVASSLTCKLWHRAAFDESLWRFICLRKWPSLNNAPFPPPIRSFHAFYAQRASNFADPDAILWLANHPVTFYLDVSLSNSPFFSQVVTSSALVKDRLRFKLPSMYNGEAFLQNRQKHWDFLVRFKDLHVQLSLVRHSDGESACVVNGFPAEKGAGIARSGQSAHGVRCVLMLLDNHAFLHFFW